MSKAVRTSRGLRVEPIGPRRWRFVHPPLHAELSERLAKAITLRETGQVARAERVLRAILLELPDHLDALHHLALVKDALAESAVAVTIWEEAVRLGRSAFPGAFDRQRDRLEWRHRENRPYLRCLRAYAMASQDEGEITRAVSLCRELLGLDPADDQGVRALAVDMLLELGRPADVVMLCDCYPRDSMPELRYGLALALFQMGRRDHAYRALLAALARAPLSHRQGRLWDTTDGALDWLREVTAGAERAARRLAPGGWSSRAPSDRYGRR
jgi:tetratricopeptide (TPR) repeat protein